MLMRNSRTKFNSFKPTSKTLKIEESIKWHAMNRQKLIDVLVPPYAFEKFKNINFQTQRSVISDEIGELQSHEQLGHAGYVATLRRHRSILSLF